MVKLVMPFGRIERTVPPNTASRPKAKGQQAKSAKRILPSSLRLVMPPGKIERTVPRPIVESTPKVKAQPSESAKRITPQLPLRQSPVDAWLAAGALPIALDPTSIEACAMEIKRFGRVRQRRYRAWLYASVAFWYDVAITIFNDPALFAAIKDAPFIREARIGKIVDGKPAKEPSPLVPADLCRVTLQLSFNKHAASAYNCRVDHLWQKKADAREVLAFLQDNGLRDKPRQSGHQDEREHSVGASTPARRSARPPVRSENAPPSPPSNRPPNGSAPVRRNVSMSGVLSGTVTIAASDAPEETCVVITTVTKTASGKLEATSVLE